MRLELKTSFLSCLNLLGLRRNVILELCDVVFLSQSKYLLSKIILKSVELSREVDLARRS
jgi:hypothetical protein